MKILIDEMEDYPVYSISRDIKTKITDIIVEVSDEQLSDWEQVLKEYKRIQQEIQTVYKQNES